MFCIISSSFYYSSIPFIKKNHQGFGTIAVLDIDGWWLKILSRYIIHMKMNFHCIIIWILHRINTKSSIKKSTYDKITITDQLKSVYSFRLIDKLKLELTFIFLLCFANSSKYSYFLNLLIFFIPILWCFHSSTIRIIECFLEEMNRLI